jgi:hypothetical protein
MIAATNKKHYCITELPGGAATWMLIRRELLLYTHLRVNTHKVAQRQRGRAVDQSRPEHPEVAVKGHLASPSRAERIDAVATQCPFPSAHLPYVHAHTRKHGEKHQHADYVLLVRVPDSLAPLSRDIS